MPLQNSVPQVSPASVLVQAIFAETEVPPLLNQRRLTSRILRFGNSTLTSSGVNVQRFEIVQERQIPTCRPNIACLLRVTVLTQYVLSHSGQMILASLFHFPSR